MIFKCSMDDDFYRLHHLSTLNIKNYFQMHTHIYCTITKYRIMMQKKNLEQKINRFVYF